MTIGSLTRRIRRRLSGEHGFTLLFALGTLTVCTLLVGAVLLAVQADAGLTSADLSGKRAYAAAQAGAQAYLFNLNDNSASSAWWQTCSNDTGSGTVPGNTDETYSFAPVKACVNGSAVGTVLDELTGQLRIEFTGKSGTATRTLVVAFRTLSPLSYVWYTVYETVDPVLDPNGNCDRFYYASPGPDSSCDISWASQDSVNGPMYSQDQFLIDGSPTFGRTASDSIASEAPTSSICVGGCGSADIKGTPDPGAPYVPLPTDNSNLEPDAKKYGDLLAPGTTTLTITGNVATGATCSSSSVTSCTPVSVNLASEPILYAPNGPGCSSSYTPNNVPTPATIGSGSAFAGDYYGPCGDVYLLTSSYNTGATIASEDDIIIEGNVTDASSSGGVPTGNAMLGLVADQFVRVGHPQNLPNSGCANPDRTIDAAILTLQNSFFVDNYDCGNGSAYGKLTVYGAIAQEYRGIVALNSGSDGYAKNYNYDDRLAYQIPPYMFDLQDASWQVVRETECAAGQAKTSPQSCAYTGTGS